MLKRFAFRDFWVKKEVNVKTRYRPGQSSDHQKRNAFVTKGVKETLLSVTSTGERIQIHQDLEEGNKRRTCSLKYVLPLVSLRVPYFLSCNVGDSLSQHWVVGIKIYNPHCLLL